MPVTDLLGRPLRNLRLSVTDRCNLRCSYCMPEAEYVWLPREDLLQFEEMSTLIDVFSRAGVENIRITGGEPLLRRDLPQLVEMIARKPAIRDLALTTNGVTLAGQAKALREAGLHRITVSLDTLQPERFQALTRFDALPQVLAGIEEARTYFSDLKIDAVIIRGTNDEEVGPVARLRSQHRRRAAVHRVHGRGRRHPVVAGARGVARGDPRAAEPALRAYYCRGGNHQRAGRSLHAAGRHRVRRHFLHHGALLRTLRSQPADCGWDVVPLPLRHGRHGSADAAAIRDVRGRAAQRTHVRLERARRPRCARSVSPCAIARRWSRPAA